MPLYEYRCRACGQTHEIRHGFNERVGTACACGGELARVFNPAGIVFKGSGFYVTDSRKGAGGGKGEGSAPAAGASDSSSSAKTSAPAGGSDASPSSASTSSSPASASATPAGSGSSSPPSSPSSPKSDAAA